MGSMPSTPYTNRRTMRCHSPARLIMKWPAPGTSNRQIRTPRRLARSA
jgi:hypothetical protein